MGFFKKVFKGIGKVFKKIGRSIKKGFAKFGKFMGKLGIAGQLAMMFIVPGIGGALFKGLGSMAGNMAALQGSFAGLSGSALGAVVKGVGTVLKAGHGFVQTGMNAFKTVTSGLMEFGKTALNKIPGVNIQGASTNFFGQNSVMEKVSLDAKNIMNPFKDSLTIGKNMTLDKLSGSTGLSIEQLKTLNPDIASSMTKDGFSSLAGKNLNLDFAKVTPDLNGITNQIKNPVLSVENTFGTDVTKADNLNFKVSDIQTELDIGKLDPEFVKVQSGDGLLRPFDPTQAMDTLQPGQIRSPVEAVGTTDFGVEVDSLLAPKEKNIFQRAAGNAIERVKGQFEADPFGTIKRGVEQYQSMTAKPPEEEYVGGGTGYVPSVLPMTDVRSADMSQVLNASTSPYGAPAVGMDYLSMLGSPQYSQFRFPGMSGAGP